MLLAQTLAFIDDDELVEVTPLSVRLSSLCKHHLTENDRKHAFSSNKE